MPARFWRRKPQKSASRHAIRTRKRCLRVKQPGLFVQTQVKLAGLMPGCPIARLPGCPIEGIAEGVRPIVGGVRQAPGYIRMKKPAAVWHRGRLGLCVFSASSALASGALEQASYQRSLNCSASEPSAAAISWSLMMALATMLPATPPTPESGCTLWPPM